MHESVKPMGLIVGLDEKNDEKAEAIQLDESEPEIAASPRVNFTESTTSTPIMMGTHEENSTSPAPLVVQCDHCHQMTPIKSTSRAIKATPTPRSTKFRFSATPQTANRKLPRTPA